MSQRTQSSSLRVSQKSVPNPFPKDIVAPDRHPRVRWHTPLYVTIFRNGFQCLLFLIFLAIFFVLGPTMVTFLYPNIIIPFAAELNWRCPRHEIYSHFLKENLAWETKLTTPSVDVEILVYLKNHTESLDKMDRILMVLDDCFFDDYQGNLILCRPIFNPKERFSFKQSVDLANVCYDYIRRITKRTEIVGYGTGITANVLLTTAGNLREESCLSFSKLFLKNPVVSVRKKFEKNQWIGLALGLSWYRDSMISEALQHYGLEHAEIPDNLERIGNLNVSVITDGDYDSNYGEFEKFSEGTIKDLTEFMNFSPLQQNKMSPNSFQFRHLEEKKCYENSTNIPLTSLIIF